LTRSMRLTRSSTPSGEAASIGLVAHHEAKWLTQHGEIAALLRW
jgi:hypothetical protein